MTTVMVAYQSVSNESSPWSTVTDSITPGRRNPSLSSSQPQAAQGLPSPGRLGPGSLELCVCHRQLEVPRLARECGGIELSVPQNHCDQPTKVSPRRAASEPLARSVASAWSGSMNLNLNLTESRNPHAGEGPQKRDLWKAWDHRERRSLLP